MRTWRKKTYLMPCCLFQPFSVLSCILFFSVFLGYYNKIGMNVIKRKFAPNRVKQARKMLFVTIAVGKKANSVSLKQNVVGF